MYWIYIALRLYRIAYGFMVEKVYSNVGKINR